ncbi:MAG TPA: phosphate propanoyltransferase [Symbiobacteriaceae bacterium]|jgi:putative phosphotransacetylase|nr:phosphate propanoyltransferase [Symbiobacteriaceae bacterium]
MNEEQLVELIVKEVMAKLKDQPQQKREVVCNVSARHIHLSQAHVEALFGEGYQLTKLKDLMQPGQFACNETVAVIGPKGTFPKVRILGPARGDTQLEISATDARTIGVQPVVRMSGKVQGTPGFIIEGPKGRVTVEQGAIVAARHIHATPADAERFGVKDGQAVRVRKTGDRAVVFENVVFRVSPNFALEMHLDTDEANAAFIKDGDMLEIIG